MGEISASWWTFFPFLDFFVVQFILWRKFTTPNFRPTFTNLNFHFFFVAGGGMFQKRRMYVVLAFSGRNWRQISFFVLCFVSLSHDRDWVCFDFLFVAFMFSDDSPQDFVFYVKLIEWVCSSRRIWFLDFNYMVHSAVCD